MKNKNEKCCGKINGVNVFIGLLMGVAVLVFGWKVYLQQHPAPEPQVLDSMQIDQALEKAKKDESKTMDFAGTWKSEGENPTTLGLNSDGTVADMEAFLGPIVSVLNSGTQAPQQWLSPEPWIMK